MCPSGPGSPCGRVELGPAWHWCQPHVWFTCPSFSHLLRCTAWGVSWGVQGHVCEHVCVCACVQAGVCTGMGAGVSTDVCACVPRFINPSQRMFRQDGCSLALDPSMALRPVCAHLPEPDSLSPWPRLLRTEHWEQLPAITGMFMYVPSGEKTKTKTGTVCQHDWRISH